MINSVYCGFESYIKVFDLLSPSTPPKMITTTKTRKSKDGQKGILSSISFNPDYSGIYAVGSYKRSLGVYDYRNDECLLLKRNVEGGGITQTTFSPDGKYIYFSSRRSDYISCFDLRNTAEVLHRFERPGKTSQRLAFSLDLTGRYLSSGDTVFLFQSSIFIGFFCI